MEKKLLWKEKLMTLKVKIFSAKPGLSHPFFLYAGMVLDFAVLGGIAYYLYHHYMSIQATKALQLLPLFLPTLIVGCLLRVMLTFFQHAGYSHTRSRSTASVKLALQSLAMVCLAFLGYIYLQAMLPWRLFAQRLSHVQGFFRRLMRDAIACIAFIAPVMLVVSLVCLGLVGIDLSVTEQKREGATMSATVFAIFFTVMGGIALVSTAVILPIFYGHEVFHALSWHGLLILVPMLISTVGLFGMPSTVNNIKVVKMLVSGDLRIDDLSGNGTVSSQVVNDKSNTHKVDGSSCSYPSC